MLENQIESLSTKNSIELARTETQNQMEIDQPDSRQEE
jgi:hypothetical protein